MVEGKRRVSFLGPMWSGKICCEHGMKGIASGAATDVVQGMDWHKQRDSLEARRLLSRDRVIDRVCSHQCQRELESALAQAQQKTWL